MPDQDIFTKPETATTPVVTNDTASTDPFADKLKGILDDTGKPKYETVDKALEALAHSQAHIKTLEGDTSTRDTEITRLREELAKRDTVENFVERLAPTKPETVAPVTAEAVAGMDADKVAELIQSTLSQRENAANQAQNINTVVNTLKEKFGESARAEVSKKAQELGISVEELQNMSADKPKLVLSLFGTKANSTAPTTSSRTTIPTDVANTVDEKVGLLRGGITSKELTAGWKAIGKEVHKKYGIDS